MLLSSGAARVCLLRGAGLEGAKPRHGTERYGTVQHGTARLPPGPGPERPLKQSRAPARRAGMKRCWKEK